MHIIDFSFIDAISFMMWLIASYGLSKIFKKFNIEGWWAFIPGARIYPHILAGALRGQRGRRQDRYDL